MGLVALLLCNAASAWLAFLIVSKIGTGKPHLDFVLVLVTRLALISLVVLVAGLTGTLAKAPLGLAGLCAVLALSIHHLWKRPTYTLPFPEIHIGVKTLFALVAIRTLAQVWYLAPYNYDALSYHLTKVAEWIRARGFTREMGIDTHAPFPAGFELIEAWWAVFPHHDALIEMAGAEFLILAAAGTYSLARTIGLSANMAGISAAAYLTCPGLALNAVSCLNDAAVASLVVATMALVAAGTPLALLAMPIGLGIGIKPTFIYALPGIVLLWFLLRRSRLSEPSRHKFQWVTCAAGLFIGVFWYVRNAAWFGNPIYPVGTGGLFTPTGTITIQYGLSFKNAIANILELLINRITDKQHPLTPLLPGISGWGPLSFSCGTISLVIVLLQNRFLRLVAAAFGLSLISVLSLVNHDPWNNRFVLFFPALLCISIGWVAETRPNVLKVAIPILAVQLAFSLIPADISLGAITNLAGQSVQERSHATVAEAAHQQAEIAYWSEETRHLRGESYLLYHPDFSARVVYIRASTAWELYSAARQHGTKLLYVSVTSPEHPPILTECVERGLLRNVHGRFYVIAE